MKKIIHASNAPQAIGPYSHAVVANGFLFASGQIGTDPVSGKMTGTDAGSQARQCLRNLDGVLAAAGLTKEAVVKVNIYLTDMKDFAAVNEAYKEYFTTDYPARCCVAVKDMAAGAVVEIDLVAAIGNG